MMKRILCLLLIIIPVFLFSQEKTTETGSEKKQFPVQAVKSDLFVLKNLSISKLVPNNDGEVLEVQFQLDNNINESMEFYIFIIATYEDKPRKTSSFESPSLEKDRTIKLIKTMPEDLSNFEYTEKDRTGNEKKLYIKYPKNVKAGVNPATGKPYTLGQEDLTVRASFLSKYQRVYYFYNEVAILIFDSKEQLVYNQFYKVKEVFR